MDSSCSTYRVGKVQSIFSLPVNKKLLRYSVVPLFCILCFTDSWCTANTFQKTSRMLVSVFFLFDVYVHMQLLYGNCCTVDHAPKQLLHSFIQL